MKVALVQGGLGGERDVSLSTGRGFEEALKELGYNYSVIDAREDFPEQIAKLKPDVALLALHGKYAEDGVVQGVLEYLKIPYTGSGVLASALCMNKIATKQILIQSRLPTPDFEVLNSRKGPLRRSNINKIDLPLVIKPSREGSSLGVSIVRTEEEVQAALDLAARFDHLVLVEEYIDGMELAVPLLRGQPLTPIEIVPKNGFYDYQNKYTAGRTDYFLPARVDEKTVVRAKEIAKQVYEVLEIRTYCRVDFKLDRSFHPFVIEVNTLPGCTPTSLYPRAAAQDGVPFKELIRILIEEATLDYADLT